MSVYKEAYVHRHFCAIHLQLRRKYIKLQLMEEVLSRSLVSKGHSRGRDLFLEGKKLQRKVLR